MQQEICTFWLNLLICRTSRVKLIWCGFWQSADSRVRAPCVERKASLLPDQDRVLHLHSLLRPPATNPIQNACRLLLLNPQHLKDSMSTTNVDFFQYIILNPLPVGLLCQQCRPWGRGAFQYVSGGCREPACSSQHGLPSLEQSAASPGHTGGHGAHLPETHHSQYIEYMGCFLRGWALARCSKLFYCCVGGVVWRPDWPGSDRWVGGAAGQLLPVPLERRWRPRTTRWSAVVQPERRERPALRL